MAILFTLFLVFGVITAAIAAGKGRNGIGWFFIGALFGLLGMILAIVLPPNPPVGGAS